MPHPVVRFMYLLLRDHLPLGVLNGILVEAREEFPVCPGESLRQLAAEQASRLYLQEDVLRAIYPYPIVRVPDTAGKYLIGPARDIQLRCHSFVLVRTEVDAFVAEGYDREVHEGSRHLHEAHRLWVSSPGTCDAVETLLDHLTRENAHALILLAKYTGVLP